MTYSELVNEINKCKEIPNVDNFLIGKSLLGEDIVAFHIGNYSGKQILIEGAIHAREYVTSLLIVELIKYYATKEVKGGVYFIPLVNPDGVRLVLDGKDWIECEKLRNYVYNINNNSDNFSLWKANGEGVDLNVNFDALWGEGLQNVFCPASENFVGFYPNSEREVRNLISFMLKEPIDLTLSYHTKGEVIYYGFEVLSEESLNRDLEFAQVIADITGYEILKTYGSVGGFSDWVSLQLDIPAFTVEVGNPNTPHPIGVEFLPEIFDQNKNVLEGLLAKLNSDDI